MRDFGAMVGPLRPQLVAKAMRFARSRALAEDLVQDSLLRALEAWSRWVPEPGLTEEDAFRGWLYRIITNVAIGHMRARDRHGRMMGIDNANDPGHLCQYAANAEISERTMATPPAPPDSVVHQEISDETLRLVASIPAKYWDAVAATAKAEVDASSRDVAAITGDTPVNVRKKLYRLRRYLCTGLITLIVMLSACTSWSKRDVALELAFDAAQSVDAVQTEIITGNCNELNPVIGRCGGPISIPAYFMTTAVLHAVVTAVLPRGWYRTAWQGITLGAESDTVIGNALSMK